VCDSTHQTVSQSAVINDFVLFIENSGKLHRKLVMEDLENVPADSETDEFLHCLRWRVWVLKASLYQLYLLLYLKCVKVYMFILNGLLLTQGTV